MINQPKTNNMRAKLFDLSDTLQVLVKKCHDEQEDKPAVEYEFLGNKNLELKMTATYQDEETRDKRFDMIQEPEIELMYKNMKLFSWS